MIIPLGNNYHPAGFILTGYGLPPTLHITLDNAEFQLPIDQKTGSGLRELAAQADCVWSEYAALPEPQVAGV